MGLYLVSVKEGANNSECYLQAAFVDAKNKKEALEKFNAKAYYNYKMIEVNITED